jgi:hypothetical protein
LVYFSLNSSTSTADYVTTVIEALIPIYRARTVSTAIEMRRGDQDDDDSITVPEKLKVEILEAAFTTFLDPIPPFFSAVISDSELLETLVCVILNEENEPYALRCAATEVLCFATSSKKVVDAIEELPRLFNAIVSLTICIPELDYYPGSEK